MYCPKCRTEYRPGFTRCTDCFVDLVHELPPAEEPVQDESAPVWLDAEFMAEVWRGEDTVLYERLLAGLKKEGIPYETKPTREAAGCGIDPVARGVEPRFGFIVRVQLKDSPMAAEILRKLLEADSVDFSIPTDDSATRGRATSRTAARFLTPSATEEEGPQEMQCVWEGSDAAKRDFVRASLSESGITTESSLQGRSYRILVGETGREKAVATIKEIVDGAPSSFEPPDEESRAETSFTKYQIFFCSLATGLVAPIALLFLLQFVAESHLVAQLLTFLAVCTVLGAVWTTYQALRYELHPGLYLLMAVIPFSFVWYYLGRYKARTSALAGPSFGQPPG